MSPQPRPTNPVARFKGIRLAAAIVAVGVVATACMLPFRPVADAATDSAAASDDVVEAAPAAPAARTQPVSAPSARPEDAQPEADDLLATLSALDAQVTDREATSNDAVDAANAEGPFVVGDSTFVRAAGLTGLGSAVAGLGFTDEAPHGVNPLVAPPEAYDGLVVLGVSVWDMWSEDLSGYTEATELYRDLGYDVVWIGVPPVGGEFTEAPGNPLLVDLNAAVEDLLGCELVDWETRYVEYEDGIHPTEAGATDIVNAAAQLTAADACGAEAI